MRRGNPPCPPFTKGGYAIRFKLFMGKSDEAKFQAAPFNQLKYFPAVIALSCGLWWRWRRFVAAV